jgi:hypothetical protein
MPKPLFYAGTAFCLFIALSAATAVMQPVSGFVAVHGSAIATSASAPWVIAAALLAGFGAAAMLIRMAALLAVRHLFGAFVALVTAAGGIVSLSWLLLLQARMLMLARAGIATTAIAEMHFAALMMLGYFTALSLLALRPYFRVQASRVLSVLVMFPLPLFLLILMQELVVTGKSGPLPASTPASHVFAGVLSVLFFSIAVHCIRHRHMFLETTNLRELLDSRVSAGTTAHRPIGGVAFDS